MIIVTSENPAIVADVNRLFFLLHVSLLCLSTGATQNLAAATRPNIIYILADDLGYGDLSCYGQQTLRTPHLDRMAKEGIRFTRHYAGSTVCAPSRCVLMTGLHTGHARVRGNGPGTLQPSDLTVASLLQESGYETGCFGKWGIGNPPPHNDPNQHGFNEFYGYINMFHAHNYYPEFLVRNGVKETLRNQLFPDWKSKQTPEREGMGVAKIAVDYAPELIFSEALDFIESNQEKPFFLYYALNIPHANNEGASETRVGRNGMRSPQFRSFSNEEWPIQEKGFAGMIETIDHHVGQILKLLKELELDEQTAVFFSSDNGPHQEGGHKMDFFDSNGSLRGMKRDLYEGGIRVPLIARWPGRFPSNQESDLISGFQDIFPTFAALAQIDSVPTTDGLSIAPTLLGQAARQFTHPHLYWEFYEQGGKVSVLKGNWKAVKRNFISEATAPIELYNLESDLSETQDVSGEHPALIRSFARIMTQEHIAP